MNTNWIKVAIFTSPEGIEPVCGMLYQLGINGVEIVDADDFKQFLENNRQYWDYVDEDLLREKSDAETCIITYINDSPNGYELLAAIREGVNRVRSIGEEMELGRLEVATDMVNEEDWANNWKKYYKPIEIGKTLLIVPKWEKNPQTERTIVKINPGMMFGTGTHESTRMCMALLEEYVKPGMKMLDIGAGSGILVITALLLGAENALAVDIDENVSDVVAENAMLNGVQNKITARKNDLVAGIKEKYDLITANIVADVIIRLSADIPDRLNKNGVFIASGIITERENDVINVLEKAGLKIINVIRENDWTAIAANE